jgi:hypothetical protein
VHDEVLNVLLEFVFQTGGILHSATETKVDTGVEIVKCSALLHNIITDVESLHDSSYNGCGSLEANVRTHFKKSRIYNFVSVSAKQTRYLFCKYFSNPHGSVP